jgi:hypothetical protein
VAIRQLPCPEVVDLGIAFVEHVAGESQPGLLSQLARAGRLLRRSASAEQFAAAVRGLAQYRSVRRTWYDWPLIVLDDAVHSLAAAVEAAGPASAGTHEAGIAVAACARSLREVLQQQYRKKKPKELEWQIKRTRELLQALTAPGLPRIA